MKCSLAAYVCLGVAAAVRNSQDARTQDVRLVELEASGRAGGSASPYAVPDIERFPGGDDVAVPQAAAKSGTWHAAGRSLWGPPSRNSMLAAYPDSGNPWAVGQEQGVERGEGRWPGTAGGL